ncbi:MAG: hypothetical protein LJE95_02575 [Acidobacteria bacterium]|nr:hypothetical protein [Acidobacteriota bacterium]
MEWLRLREGDWAEGFLPWEVERDFVVLRDLEEEAPVRDGACEDLLLLLELALPFLRGVGVSFLSGRLFFLFMAVEL